MIVPGDMVELEPHYDQAWTTKLPQHLIGENNPTMFAIMRRDVVLVVSVCNSMAFVLSKERLGWACLVHLAAIR